MSMEHVIDLDSLLTPISENEPQGSDLRADRSPNSLYYAIKDARNNARAAERSAMFDEDVDLMSPWKQVADLAPAILRETSKDLEVSCWYTEALIRLHGLSGLRDGLQLIKKLIEDHWEGLYPQPDEDGIETKVAPLTGLNGDGGEGTLLAPLRNMPITLEEAGGAFSLWQYQQARDADRIVDEDEKVSRFDSLGYSLKSISDTIAATAVPQAVSVVETLEECLDLFKSSQALLRSHCDHEAPPSSNISNLLEELLRTARFIYKEKLEAAQVAQEATQNAAAESESADAAGTSGLPVTGISAPSGAISDREDALKRLETVAEYFRRYEPHSPIGPGLERLATWGRMTVAELMMELLPEDSAKGIFSQLTGVKLDGSDTATYIAPPKAAAPQAANPPSQAAPAAEAEQNEASMGW
ncbi:type VI secretion system protein TssA [Simiduia agarivorans]|uniref:Type VI secretion-associated protein, ImpA family n=1 Tax=Simiduia agarivorans (strain DSM 21679 / JCM 13881 / BCRC 17597 / SA1) TaxID=1117647 RepID=K4KJC5_SIMAS|nr:type VI secretion system protein TssA [Simiduia agarivorans]AFU98093.1 type VI secretion-associated protein, ImpA family [Simiduia agarivorans SA1 = DSM 21679]